LEPEPGLSPGRRKEFFFFKTTRPALGTIQPPIQRVPGVVSSGIRRRWCETDYWPRL